MSAEIIKFDKSVPTDPRTFLGMLISHADKIRGIVGVVIWDDDTFQVVNTVIPHSSHAFAAFLINEALRNELIREDMDEDSSK